METISLKRCQSRNIIIFGESGVGKSAVINQIYDEPLVKSSSQAVGCTKNSVQVSRRLKSHPNLLLNLYDTVGLSESAEGSVSTASALVQLIKLAYAIPTGINLLICCAAKGRLSSERFKANYRIFKEQLCEDRIPCLLVITHCDNDDPIDDWWHENEDHVVNKLKFRFVDAVCVSTLKAKKKKPDHILEDYKVSRQNLIAAIRKYSLPEPIKIDSWSRRVIVAARSFFNSFTEWFPWLKKYEVSLRPELVKMLIELNYSQENAEKEIEKLLKELAEKDLFASYDIITA